MSKNSLSVAEFCYQEGFSKAMFYKIVKQGLGPRLIKIGRRTLISVESAADWRKKMERQSLEGSNNVA